MYRGIKTSKSISIKQFLNDTFPIANEKAIRETDSESSQDVYCIKNAK